MPYACSAVDGVGNGGTGGVDDDLADGLGTEGAGGLIAVLKLHLQTAHIQTGGNFVLQEGGLCGAAIAVAGHILHQSVADAPDDTAFGLDPGQVGVDGDAVVETKRGHNLGRVLWSGSAAANTIADAQRNITIAALSLSIGLGFTQVPDMFSIFPTLVRTIFAENCVVVVFLGAIIMNPIMPMNSEA